MPVPSSPCCSLSPFYLPAYHSPALLTLLPKAFPDYTFFGFHKSLTFSVDRLVLLLCLPVVCITWLWALQHLLPGCAPQHLARGWAQRRCPGPVCWNEQNVLMVLMILNLKSYSSSCLVAFKFWHCYLLIVWAWAGLSISLSLNFSICNYNLIP